MCKVGSIVVILKAFHVDDREKYKKDVKWLPINDESTMYVIRSIFIDDASIAFVTFEEGIIGYGSPNMELGVNIKFVREVAPPEDISEEIKEYQSIPVKDRELLLT